MTITAKAQIEHVNITTSNNRKTAAMLCAVFGWHIRWEGPSKLGGHSIHVGNETSYIAVYSKQEITNESMVSSAAEQPEQFKKGQPMNHIGIMVDDLDAAEASAITAGLTPFAHGDYEPGRRFYFFDHDGVEYEVVSYT